MKITLPIFILLSLVFFVGCTQSSKNTFPLCGVVTTNGYRLHEAKEEFGEKVADAILLVPDMKNPPLVKRYQIVDHYRLPGFLEAHASWWVCVNKGKIAKEAHAELNNYSLTEYGILIVDDFSVDQSNGERGAE